MLNNRSKELRDAYGVRYPDPRAGVLNTAQSDVSLGIIISPCVVPYGEFWLLNRGRTFAGREPLNMQSIFCRPEVTMQFGDQLLLDLVGNAFSALSGIVAHTVLLVALSLSLSFVARFVNE